NISANATRTQNGVTIAGGKGKGGATNQLDSPLGLFVDDDQTVVIADRWNNRIMQWKNGDTTNGQVVAGGNAQGNGLNQLSSPIDVLIDKEIDCLIICDSGDQRIVRWSRRSGTTQGEVLIGTTCAGLVRDEQRYLYVCGARKHDVRRYQLGEKNGILVAGGNGKGDELNQLSYPTYLFVNGQQNVYVSDCGNHRVMKWTKGATEDGPQGIFVNTLGALYVADSGNHRVMRWTQGDKKQGTVIVCGNGYGAGANQFSNPVGLCFDRYVNLYVADQYTDRVQRFSIEKDC
ncbi:unnamed protein product, partial [Rotaria magnacalcarata]